MAKSLMVLSTSAKAGKSFFIAALCRIFAQDGYKVAPFKVHSIASDTIYTDDDFEIDTVQCSLATAALKKADLRMNPILLKPCGEDKFDVIVMGKLLGAMSMAEYYERFDEIFEDVFAAYKGLASENDIIIIEADGHPTEKNPRSINNMDLARRFNAPVFILTDYSLGGAFSSAYGAFAFHKDDVQHYIKGVVINKIEVGEESYVNNLEKLKSLTNLPLVAHVHNFHEPVEQAENEGDSEDSLKSQITKRKSFFESGELAQDNFRSDYGGIGEMFPSFDEDEKNNDDDKYLGEELQASVDTVETVPLTQEQSFGMLDNSKSFDRVLNKLAQMPVDINEEIEAPVEAAGVTIEEAIMQSFNNIDNFDESMNELLQSPNIDNEERVIDEPKPANNGINVTFEELMETVSNNENDLESIINEANPASDVMDVTFEELMKVASDNSGDFEVINNKNETPTPQAQPVNKAFAEAIMYGYNNANDVETPANLQSQPQRDPILTSPVGRQVKKIRYEDLFPEDVVGVASESVAETVEARKLGVETYTEIPIIKQEQQIQEEPKPHIPLNITAVIDSVTEQSELSSLEPVQSKKIKTENLRKPLLLNIAVIKLPNRANQTNYNFLITDNTDITYVDSVESYGNPDLVLIPDTSKPMSDFLWMRSIGLEKVVRESAESGVLLLGVCGGYHMLFETIADHYGIDSGGEIECFGFFKAKTALGKDRKVSKVRGIFKSFEGIFSPLNGKNFNGHAVLSSRISHSNHKNISVLIDQNNGLARQDGLYNKNVFGLSVFGLLENKELVKILTSLLSKFKASKKKQGNTPIDNKIMALNDSRDVKLSINLSKYTNNKTQGVVSGDMNPPDENKHAYIPSTEIMAGNNEIIEDTATCVLDVSDLDVNETDEQVDLPTTEIMAEVNEIIQDITHDLDLIETDAPVDFPATEIETYVGETVGKLDAINDNTPLNMDNVSDYRAAAAVGIVSEDVHSFGSPNYNAGFAEHSAEASNVVANSFVEESGEEIFGIPGMKTKKNKAENNKPMFLEEENIDLAANHVKKSLNVKRIYEIIFRGL